MDKGGKEWLHAALIRALRTFCQTALSMITIGAAMSEIDWAKILSISLVSGIISILTSVATGLPEVKTYGEIVVNTDISQDSAILGMTLDQVATPEYMDELASKGSINLRVKKD